MTNKTNKKPSYGGYNYSPDGKQIIPHYEAFLRSSERGYNYTPNGSGGAKIIYHEPQTETPCDLTL